METPDQPWQSGPREIGKTQHKIAVTSKDALPNEVSILPGVRQAIVRDMLGVVVARQRLSQPGPAPYFGLRSLDDSEI